jgi:hypothetical protein
MWSNEDIKAAARAAIYALADHCALEVTDAQGEAVARAVLNAALRWRPIESAPKDGTPVLTKVEDSSGSYEPAVSRWFSLDTLRGNPTVGYLPDWRDGVWLPADPDDFESDQALASYICGSDYQPTHFMRLPK